MKVSPIVGRAKGDHDVGTPANILNACRLVFGQIAFDLAGSVTNHVHTKYYSVEQDTLHPETRWPMYAPHWKFQPHGHETYERWLWLNPPYDYVEPWMDRCAHEMENGRNIMVLIPASVGARWWARWVDPYAYVLPLTGRLKFIGHTNTFPRDLALCLYTKTWSPSRAFPKGVNPEELGLCPSFRKMGKYLGPWDWQKVAKIT